MFVINMDQEETIKYNILNLDNVSIVNFVIVFSNDVNYKYPATIDLETNEVTIIIPILKDMIKNEIMANSYLEIILKSGVYYKTNKDTILLKKSNVLNTDTISEFSFQSKLLTRSEIALDMSKIILTKKGK